MDGAVKAVQGGVRSRPCPRAESAVACGHSITCVAAHRSALRGTHTSQTGPPALFPQLTTSSRRRRVTPARSCSVHEPGDSTTSPTICGSSSAGSPRSVRRKALRCGSGTDSTHTRSRLKPTASFSTAHS